MTGKIAYIMKLVASDETVIILSKAANTLDKLLIEQPHDTKLNKLNKQYPEGFWY
jgi:hypothetical protein